MNWEISFIEYGCDTPYWTEALADSRLVPAVGTFVATTDKAGRIARGQVQEVRLDYGQRRVQVVCTNVRRGT